MLIYLQMPDMPEERTKFETLYYNHRRTMLHIAMQTLKDHQLAENAAVVCHRKYDNIKTQPLVWRFFAKIRYN